MPPVVAAIAIASAWAAAHVLAATIIMTLISTAISLGMAALTKKKASSINQAQELSLKLDPNLPRAVALGGPVSTGGSSIWAFTYTDDSAKPNRYLVRIIQLSDYPINRVTRIHDGEQWLTLSGDPNVGEVYVSGAHLKKDSSASMWVRVYPGVLSGAVADASLISASGGQWTANHKGTGLAYAYVRYDYDPENAFPKGEPTLVWEMEGAKIYDDRLDSTKTNPTRTGSQRLADPTTWAYSNNMAVLTAQTLRGISLNGQLIIGAQAEERDLPDAMLLDAYNICDQTVPVIVAGVTTTQKRYTGGAMLSADASTDSMLADFETCMDGRIYDRGGIITIRPGAVHTPIFALTDNDIDWSAEHYYQDKATLDGLYNYVSGSYISPVDAYVEKPFPPLKNSAWEAEDGGERLTHDMALAYITDDGRSQRISKRVAAASRYQSIVGFVGGTELLEMEQGDWFTFTSDSNHWNFSKTFIAEEVNIQVDGSVAVVGQETSAAVDNWTPSTDQNTTGGTTTTTPTGLPPVPMPSFTLASGATAGTGGNTYPYTKITLTNLSSFISATFIQIRPQGDADPTHIVSAGTHANTDQNPVITLTSQLTPGVAYDLRAQYSASGRPGDWSAWTSVTQPDATVVGTTVGATEGVATPGAGLTHFTLSKAMSAGSEVKALVWVGGQLQASSQYTFNGTTTATLAFSMSVGDTWRTICF